MSDDFGDFDSFSTNATASGLGSGSPSVTNKVQFVHEHLRALYYLSHAPVSMSAA